MKTINSIFVLLFYTIISFSTGISFAQEKTIAQLQTELISPWLVTVEGEVRTRTLRITGAAQKPDGTLLVEALYGWTDANQSAIPASASQSGQKTALQFATQSSSQVIATQTSNGNFEGTFTYKGTTKALKIEKISEADLKLKVAAAKASRATPTSSAPEITPPGPDVPKECAAWSGGWSGEWQAPGYRNRSQLWVRSVDKDCNASIASSGPMEWKTHNVKGGRISDVFCNRQTGGICRFEISSDFSRLSANYSNTAGGHNWGEFTKVILK